MPSATSLGATGCREKQAVRPGLGVRAVNALIFRLAAGENRMMGYEAKDRARRAAKHGNGAYWGRKWEANKESSRTRRRTGGGKSEKSSPINLSDRLPCDRARGKSRGSRLCRGKRSGDSAHAAGSGAAPIPKLFRIALAGLDVARQRFEDLQRDGLLDRANVGPGLFGPDDALTHCAGIFSPVAAPGPSSPSRPWSGQTRPARSHAGSAGCA